MRIPLSVVLAILVLTPIGVVAAQSPTSDDPAELREWLDSGRNRPEYSEVLLRLLRAAPDLDTFINDLDRYENGIVLDSDRLRVYMEAGYLHETANRYFEAGRWYARVVEIDPSAWEAVVRRAAMSIEVGENREAIVLLTRVIQGAPDRALQRRAAILRARAFLLDGQYDRAFQHARSLIGEDDHDSVEPAAAILLFEVSEVLDRPDGLELARRILETHSSENPERALIDRRATYLPIPSRMIPATISVVAPTTDEQPSRLEGDVDPDVEQPPPQRRIRGVQVGSFRDPENARYMRRDMESLGFDATVEEYQIGEILYHRVLIPIPANADDAEVQARVLALKERGIEGMLIFR